MRTDALASRSSVILVNDAISETILGVCCDFAFPGARLY